MTSNFENTEITLLNAAKLALKLVIDNWILEHGQEQVGVTWGALQTAIEEPLFHVVSVDIKTNVETEMTLYPMTHSQCNIFKSKLMSVNFRRIDFKPVLPLIQEHHEISFAYPGCPDAKRVGCSTKGCYIFRSGKTFLTAPSLNAIKKIAFNAGTSPSRWSIDHPLNAHLATPL
jgi:hypothetical protein